MRELREFSGSCWISVGIGELRMRADYGDVGRNTLDISRNRGRLKSLIWSARTREHRAAESIDAGLSRWGLWKGATRSRERHDDRTLGNGRGVAGPGFPIYKTDSRGS